MSSKHKRRARRSVEWTSDDDDEYSSDGERALVEKLRRYRARRAVMRVPKQPVSSKRMRPNERRYTEQTLSVGEIPATPGLRRRFERMRGGRTMRGDYLVVREDGTHVIGNHCTIEADNCTVDGNHNTLRGDNCLLAGNHNQFCGKGTKATGRCNRRMRAKESKSLAAAKQRREPLRERVRLLDAVDEDSVPIRMGSRWGAEMLSFQMLGDRQ